MNLDWLTDPISDEAPCGPDLEATDDENFIDYYFEAESRMPERYFIPGIESADDTFAPGTLFDPESIDIKTERKKIEGLLKRSRDIRLLSLLARFEILSGNLEGLRDALTGIADLIEAFPSQAHPSTADGPADRRAALDELGNTVTICIPLQYVDLAGLGDSTYRRYLVATDQSKPRKGEEGINAASITSTIGSPSNREAVDRAHGLLSECALALSRIKSACMANESGPFTPAISRSFEAITEVQSLIRNGRSDLPLWSDGEGAPQADDTATAQNADTGAPADGATPGASADAPGAAASAPLPTDGIGITSHSAARATLEAVETYFSANEPASAALILATQARLLIGKPLVEAIETLLPADAPRAVIDFGPETGFAISMDRMRALTGEARRAPEDTTAPEPAAPVESRADVARAIRGVEDFYRRSEPASPIPLLLFKARDYLEKDFQAIVTSLVQKAATEG
ncbi:MAG: ImpA family type VI secretion system protein [Paracoccaceae bacterium]